MPAGACAWQHCWYWPALLSFLPRCCWRTGTQRDINHGPLDRRLGLATLRVYTAGTRLASVTLDGLPEARALQLRDALVAADPDVV
jgi:hypothetical protein